MDLGVVAHQKLSGFAAAPRHYTSVHARFLFRERFLLSLFRKRFMPGVDVSNRGGCVSFLDRHMWHSLCWGYLCSLSLLQFPLKCTRNSCRPALLLSFSLGMPLHQVHPSWTYILSMWWWGCSLSLPGPFQPCTHSVSLPCCWVHLWHASMGVARFGELCDYLPVSHITARFASVLSSPTNNPSACLPWCNTAAFV